MGHLARMQTLIQCSIRSCSWLIQSNLPLADTLETRKSVCLQELSYKHQWTIKALPNQLWFSISCLGQPQIVVYDLKPCLIWPNISFKYIIQCYCKCWLFPKSSIYEKTDYTVFKTAGSFKKICVP